MILTIDTSVAVKWIVDQPGYKAARFYLVALNEARDFPLYRFAAPALLILEVHNVLAKLYKKGLIPYGTLIQGVETITRTVEIDPIDMEFATTASKRSIAAPYRHRQAESIPTTGVYPPFNVYDCVFIEHASQHRHTLLTSDAEQARMAQAFGVPVEFIPTE